MKIIKQDEFTLLHHILFPIISVGISDGEFSEDEMNDLKLTANTLGEWFNHDEDASMAIAQDTYNYIISYARRDELQEILKMSLYSCALVKTSIENLDIDLKVKKSIIKNIINCLNDQAAADSKILEIEKNVVTLLSKALN